MTIVPAVVIPSAVKLHMTTLVDEILPVTAILVPMVMSMYIILDVSKRNLLFQRGSPNRPPGKLHIESRAFNLTKNQVGRSAFFVSTHSEQKTNNTPKQVRK